jgi:hypothetical protein
MPFAGPVLPGVSEVERHQGVALLLNRDSRRKAIRIVDGSSTIGLNAPEELTLRQGVSWGVHLKVAGSGERNQELNHVISWVVGRARYPGPGRGKH